MDAKGVINYGLGKIGASRVNSLSPAQSKLEKHCAEGYVQWRRSELAKRRWVFARRVEALTVNPSVTPVNGRAFAYDLPPNIVRVIRDRDTTWIQSGRYIHSYAASQELEFIVDVPEGEFDPLFLDVLAWRVVQECNEYLTQSNTKDVSFTEKYKEAVRTAGVANAFIIGPEYTQTADDLDEWELARVGIMP